MGVAAYAEEPAENPGTSEGDRAFLQLKIRDFLAQRFGVSMLSNDADTDTIGDLAAGNGLALHELARHQGSLEEAFMHITGHDVEYTAGGSAGTQDDSAAIAAAGR